MAMKWRWWLRRKWALVAPLNSFNYHPRTIHRYSRSLIPSPTHHNYGKTSHTSTSYSSRFYDPNIYKKYSETPGNFPRRFSSQKYLGAGRKHGCYCTTTEADGCFEGRTSKEKKGQETQRLGKLSFWLSPCSSSYDRHRTIHVIFLCFGYDETCTTTASRRRPEARSKWNRGIHSLLGIGVPKLRN